MTFNYSTFSYNLEKEINEVKNDSDILSDIDTLLLFVILSRLMSKGLNSDYLLEFYQEEPEKFNILKKLLIISKKDSFNIYIKTLSLLSLEEISILFEKTALSNSQKKYGVFYTPMHLAQWITSKALSKSTEEISVLDPSCGAGIFLLNTYNNLREKGIPTEEIIKNCIYGIDINKDAVRVCKILLILKVLEFSDIQVENISYILDVINEKICHGDFLLSSTEEILKKNKFSHIIGNPPYGLSRDEQITKEDNLTLREIYKSWRSGKVNKYMLFIAKGYTLLDPAGILSFIVPNSWLGITSAKKLREKLSTESSISKIISFNNSSFKTASFEEVVLIIDKSKKNASVQLEKRNSSDLILLESSEVSYSSIKRTPDFIIPLYWDDELESIFTEIENNSEKLNERFLPLIALQAYCKGKGTPSQTENDVKNKTFHVNYLEDDSCIPYLHGNNLAKDKINWSGDYIKYGKWLSEHQPIERYTSPRVLVREILGKSPCYLISAFTDEPYVYNRSILHIHKREKLSTKNELISLNTIFNSYFGSFIIKNRGRKSQRKLFPKIVNDDLKSFPIPKNKKLDLPKDLNPEDSLRAILDLYNLSIESSERLLKYI